MSIAKIPNHLLKQMYVKDDLYAAFHIGFHVFIFGIFFVASCYFLNAGYFFYGFLCLIVTGFLGNFFGWSGVGHELLHETVFSSRCLNRFLVRVFSIYLWNNWEYHKISHQIHHRSTMVTGVDFEFDPNQKHLSLWDIFISFTFNYKYLIRALNNTVNNSLGIVKGKFSELYILNDDGKYSKVKRAARSILFFHGLVFFVTLFLDIVMVSFVFSLSPFFCNVFSRILAISQHFGLESDVNDPRRTSRSLRIPRWMEFLYANMNYHIEHHMYLGIPFYNLPRAREVIERDLPEAMSLKGAIHLAINPASSHS